MSIVADLTPTGTLTVRITYTDGRDETSAPLPAPLARWFAAMMRASHGDIRTLDLALQAGAARLVSARASQGGARP